MAQPVHVSIANPDDPMGMPAYDGLAEDAYESLDPGVYPAVDGDGLDGIVVVEPDGSRFEDALL